jgi:hypothetical protein
LFDILKGYQVSDVGIHLFSPFLFSGRKRAEAGDTPAWTCCLHNSNKRDTPS